MERYIAFRSNRAVEIESLRQGLLEHALVHNYETTREQLSDLELVDFRLARIPPRRKTLLPRNDVNVELKLKSESEETLDAAVTYFSNIHQVYDVKKGSADFTFPESSSLVVKTFPELNVWKVLKRKLVVGSVALGLAGFGTHAVFSPKDYFADVPKDGRGSFTYQRIVKNETDEQLGKNFNDLLLKFSQENQPDLILYQSVNIHGEGSVYYNHKKVVAEGTVSGPVEELEKMYDFMRSSEFNLDLSEPIFSKN